MFFVEIEFKESQALFHRLAANTLPWIVHLAPGLSIGSDGPIKYKHEDVVSCWRLCSCGISGVQPMKRAIFVQLICALRCFLHLHQYALSVFSGIMEAIPIYMRTWHADAPRHLWASPLEGR